MVDLLYPECDDRIGIYTDPSAQGLACTDVGPYNTVRGNVLSKLDLGSAVISAGAIIWLSSFSDRVVAANGYSTVL